MYDAFLFHSSEDKEWIRELARRIDAQSYNGRNLKSCFDEQHVYAGDRLRPELEAALDASLFVVVVVSAASLQSKWTSFEWNHFNKLHPKDGGIIPLILEKDTKEDLPIEFRDLVHIDFSDRTDFETSFKQLIRTIAKPSARAPHILKSR
jgi:TIR domain